MLNNVICNVSFFGGVVEVTVVYSGEKNKSVFCVGHRDKECNRPSSYLTNSANIILLRNHGVRNHKICLDCR